MLSHFKYFNRRTKVAGRYSHFTLMSIFLGSLWPALLLAWHTYWPAWSLLISARLSTSCLLTISPLPSLYQSTSGAGLPEAEQRTLTKSPSEMSLRSPVIISTETWGGSGKETNALWWETGNIGRMNHAGGCWSWLPLYEIMIILTLCTVWWVVDSTGLGMDRQNILHLKEVHDDIV